MEFFLTTVLKLIPFLRVTILIALQVWHWD